MTVVLWGLLVAGGLLLAWGSPWAWLPLGLHVVLMLIGVFSMRSGILGRARTRVESGVALTYDDGPDPETTPGLLDLLKERGAKATFFVVGDHVRAHPDIVKRCVDEGHVVANHSNRHSNWTNLFFRSRMRAEIESCQNAVREATSVEPRHYRPPVGLMNHNVAPVARALGLELVAWTVRSFDTVRHGAAARVIPKLRDGAIVMLHDGAMDREQVLDTTRQILDAIEERGLKAVALG